MKLGGHHCVVCGQRISTDDGKWHSIQPRADGVYRCRACQDLGVLLSATLTHPIENASPDVEPA
jgi:hypothetical protein